MRGVLEASFAVIVSVILVYLAVAHRWEYRAVYHYDCTSYATES